MTPDEYKAEIEGSLVFDKVLKAKGIKSSLDMLSPSYIKSHVGIGMVEMASGTRG